MLKSLVWHEPKSVIPYWFSIVKKSCKLERRRISKTEKCCILNYLLIYIHRVVSLLFHCVLVSLIYYGWEGFSEVSFLNFLYSRIKLGEKLGGLIFYPFFKVKKRFYLINCSKTRTHKPWLVVTFLIIWQFKTLNWNQITINLNTLQICK